jgi:DNA polymerase
MKLIPVVIDLETFWSQDHTLSKMNPIVYCTHPETEVISCAAKVGDEQTNITFGEEAIKKQTKAFDWSDKIVIGHNLSGFDAMILRWRLGVRPAMWGCTLAMARPLHGLTVGGSLKKLVEHYGIGVKDQSALLNTKGRHLKDFSPEEIEAMRKYNIADVDQCAALFKILLPLTPKREMQLIDMTVRMLVEPKFRVDVPLLEKTLTAEQERKHLMLLDTATMIGADVIGKTDDEIADEISKTLGSAPKFAKLLKDLGVEPPMKISPTTGKETYALAKTDEEFVALTEHDDPIVAAAASARLGVKSSLLETRTQSFLNVAKATKGRMPIFLNYYAAHTGRWGGGGSLNQQNMPRIPRDKEGNIIEKPMNALRMSLTAPPGHKVVVADLSGIELRVNHFLWKVPSSMALFEADPEKADLYRDFASKMYNIPAEEVTKSQRQYAKACQLGLGFGAGPATFVRVAKIMGGIDLSLEESKEVVSKWRQAYCEIVEGWRTCNNALPAIAQGATVDVDPWGLVATDSEGFVLPSGRKIRYPNLRLEDNDGKKQWVFGDGRSKGKAYGGLCDENIVQALARDVLMDNAVAIKKETGLWPCHSVHDELIYVVPDLDAEAMLATVQRYMRTPPTWFPALRTWSEGDIADSYGSAK